MLDVVREVEDIIAMLSETETIFSDVTLDSSGNMASSVLISIRIHVTREEQHMSSYMCQEVMSFPPLFLADANNVFFPKQNLPRNKISQKIPDLEWKGGIGTPN
ncbi:hypothetical protein AAZX31_15G145300 [Glycine max]